MDILPGVPLPIALALLALLDGLSIGTLLIPLFFLLVPGRVRGGRMLLYLGTIAVFYLIVGVLFLTGLVNVVDAAGEVLSSTPGRVTRLVVGGALLVTAIAMPTGSRVERTVAAAPGGAGDEGGGEEEAPGRLARWRERLLSENAPRTAIMGVAVAAGVVEVATMVPYIVGMTMLAEAALPFPAQVGALAGYCAVMIAPALVLLLLRVVAARIVDAPLRRLAAWLQRTAAENTAWILGIVGFLVLRAAATELGLFDALSSLAG
ncbi:Sap-like sulfolipid-1-addressing protein [Microbacterium sp. AG1240]|uniref:GAP family protein n=1 Tax=Microbacterium sp. AG1240 TaxID=2183992 RepID=UPI000EB138B3|nr:GAP family protein [Microbacterium sp. AG1240]RKT31662.1 Sap-like sulfolipid-1-addressing protein [Microbacterium sp. AG1240]